MQPADPERVWSGPAMCRRQWLMLAGSCASTWPATAQTPATQSPTQREAQAPALPAPGTAIVLPRLTLLDGSTFDPAQGPAAATVLYWWASTCPFCAEQSPEMHRLWLAHGSRGLRMLTLSVDKQAQDAQAYLMRKGYTFPAAWVSPQVHAVLPKPKGLPITLVLARDGRVLQAEKGQLFPEDVARLARWLG